MRRFAIAIVALHRTRRTDALYGDNVSVRHVLGMVEADSHDEAVGKAVKIATKFYPKNKGWGDYSVSAIDVTDGNINEENPGEATL